MRRWLGVVAVAVGLLFLFVTRVPSALAFPYATTIGATQVLSDTPLDPALPARIARADALVRAAGLAGVDGPRTLVLTNSGWRWHVLALQSADAFGLRRPFSSTLLFNRSDVAADRIYIGRSGGRSRSLSGVIAHETAHLLAAHRIGEIAAVRQPRWKWEGFADHVAQESTLSPAEAEQLRRTNPDSQPLIYFDARRRVEAALRRDPSIDHLFD